MFDVYIFVWNKNRRSTAYPSLTGATPIKCKLKAPSSVLDPVIELKVNPTSQGSTIKTNYVYIPEFSRWYYVVNTILDGNIVRLYLHVDELASWKTEIQNSTQYVLRAAGDSNTYLKDGKYPLLAKAPTISGTQTENPLQPASSTYGVFVVGVISDDISLSGGVTYYAMSYLTVSTFIKSLFTLATQWQNQGQDLADALKESITDPMQYLVSMMWFPYTITDFINRGIVGAGTNSVKCGYWNMTITGSAYPYTVSVLNLEFTNLVSLTIPNHPQAASRGLYMNFSPFSRYFLSFYPFAGLVELDASKMGGNGGVYCVYTVDLRSGKGVCSICTGYNGSSYQDWTPKAPMQVIEAQIGVPIPLATIRTEMSFNPLTYMQRLAASVSSGFGGFDQVIPKTLEKWKLKANIALAPSTSNEAVAENVAGWQQQLESLPDMADILDEAATLGSTAEMIGSQGTISLNSRMPIAAWGVFYEAAAEDAARFGRPLCQSKQLSTLSGFVQCDSPVITASNTNGMMAEEREAIETMLAVGIYIL